jgi:hypothetical protein
MLIALAAGAIFHRQADSLAERLRSIDGRRHDSDACAAEKARLERTLVDLRERFESQAHLVIELVGSLYSLYTTYCLATQHFSYCLRSNRKGI